MTNEEFEKWLKEFHPEVDEVDSVRKELMERGDEMVSFRQLVERFEEVEEEYKGAPWNLKQIYNNFNILIGEKPCTDAISREDALMALTGEWTELTDEVIHRFIKRIKNLPPMVLPKPIECEDAISRQAAIRIAEKGQVQGYEWQFKQLCDLPSVTPAEKVGRWEYIQYDGNPNIGNWHCSECNRIVCGAITAVNPVYSYKYCPECGAKMREVES